MVIVDTSTQSPYQSLGGHAGIERIVAAIYVRVWADPELGPYFHRTDRDRQRNRLTQLLAAALGGPDAYTGAGLREAHAGRGITHRHFSILAAHAADVLEEQGVEPEAIDEVLAFISSTRAEVVEDPA
jgi:hemoglobin